MYDSLLLTGRILLAYLLVFKVVPALAARCFTAWDREVIPTSAGKYRISTLTASLLLYTVIILCFLRNEASPVVFYTEKSIQAGMLGTAFMALFLSVFMLLLPGEGKAQANALGLKTPRDILIHSTWYAFVWASFREELFHRGLIQTQAVGLLGTPWGLLVPMLFFSAHHAYNSPSIRVGAVWVLSTLPGSIIFTMSYHLSGSLAAPVMAHGLNNALAGLLLYLAVYHERWRKTAALFIGAAAALYLAAARNTLFHLLDGSSFDLTNGLSRSLLMLAILLAGTWLIRRIPLNRKKAA